MNRLHIQTRQRCEFVDITDQVQGALEHEGIRSGVCVAYVPHTTAGITINENADPDVPHDILLSLERLVPKDWPQYRHGEGNSDSHVKASLMGSSVILLVREGRLVLGTWQGIFFCEFDGPRRRQVHVQTIGT